MKVLRVSILVALALAVLVGSTWAGGRPPANALLLFRDGDIVTGDVFTINDRSISMLTDDGIFTYSRTDVSSVVFLHDWNALVVKAKGTFVGEGQAAGELSYVGGLWDGREAGRFMAMVHRPDCEMCQDHMMLSTELYVERNTLPRGMLKAVTVGDGSAQPTGYDGYMQEHLAGVITGASGDYEDCLGSVETIMYVEMEGPVSHFVAYYIFKFDAAH